MKRHPLPSRAEVPSSPAAALAMTREPTRFERMKADAKAMWTLFRKNAGTVSVACAILFCLGSCIGWMGMIDEQTRAQNSAMVAAAEKLRATTMASIDAAALRAGYGTVEGSRVASEVPAVAEKTTYQVSVTAANGDLVLLLVRCETKTGQCGDAFVDKIYRRAETAH